MAKRKGFGIMFDNVVVKEGATAVSASIASGRHLIIDILSRVRRCDYRKLSLVSKHFRSLVASHALYARRSLLGCTERRLYVSLSDGENSYYNPYILCRKANGKHRLVLIPWPTNMPHVRSFLTSGSKIYVFDSLNSYQHLPIPSTESRFQTLHPMPSMNNNVTMFASVAGVIDGKIYVTGYTKVPSANMVMAVFNTETQIWETATETETMIGRPVGCVVMAGKMYTRDPFNSFVYDPKECKWEIEETLNMFKWEGGRVVDDVLYYFDNLGGKVLRAYNPRESSWVVVKGLERLVAEARFSESSYTGSCGGKLVLFFSKDRRIKGIRCAQISLERRHQGRSEIWGKIDWCDDVLFRSDDLFVTKTLDVIL
ncbi:F-box/kelch-repeat protein At4g38940-like [Raphanus sativus]|uniref:F-box/kelch-repeat protein At4g38940-like n=1 Tax=Raphanus sativus TaxID=3726 RepID=A0A9W3BW41_RAPSA|nr:F-box/kelch-repeat protein At4g38940-like [Raphanus sativus]